MNSTIVLGLFDRCLISGHAEVVEVMMSQKRKHGAFSYRRLLATLSL
jgi:hypothetical protein